MNDDLSKQELLNMYQTLPEDTLRKLGIFEEAKKSYEEQQELKRLRKERIEKAKALVKEAQELLEIYDLRLIVTSRSGISIRDKDGKKIDKTQMADQKGGQKLPKGLKTPDTSYRIPILESLTELGGQGRISQILELVEEKMKGLLNEYDYEMLPSGGEVRWSNTAKWCKSSMKKEGLLSDTSPHGVWEISEAGRKYLRDNRNG